MLQYMYNIKNCITLSSLWLCGIFILVINRRWSEMEIKIYCILHLKAIEFFLGTSLAFFVLLLLLFLKRNLDAGYLAPSFFCQLIQQKVTVDVPYFLIGVFVTVEGYLGIINDVHCNFMYHKYICRSSVGNCFMSPFWGL